MTKKGEKCPKSGWKAMKVLPRIHCQMCGKLFYPKTKDESVCSSQCSVERTNWHGLYWRREGGRRLCKLCGKPFDFSAVNVNFCSEECEERYELKQLGELPNLPPDYVLAGKECKHCHFYRRLWTGEYICAFGVKGRTPETCGKFRPYGMLNKEEVEEEENDESEEV